MEQVLEGVLDACVESRCALLGGETAEMPGVYPPGGFDLAGFAVGMVDDDKVVDGRGIAAGDVLVGLPSSGVHSNGYSLVRRALVEDGLRLPLDAKPDALGGATLGEALMCPTRVYVRQALAAVAAVPVKAMAHITGGGLAGNIDRTMPEDLACALDYAAWRRPGVFALIASAGVDEEEMRRVFNLGVGYVFIVAEKDRDALLRVLEGIDERPAVIGGVVRKS
jgi:phosphoribosylaminoimidazole synthetase